ncbi:DUF1292 domain-containing protein [Vagococcus salmoninarum]|uniref:UPF0473 protein CBF35_10210 n=1 Tax=Vagococcus salmoninarum TaxID=2739 RepID=A0A429ZKU9_9ENTE|nr:DUF1292 domain-containing protein [Vagococcus salmoninarum]MBE9388375.1 DUF1292 domain-containing protein [Vagococcus salmoninarum]RST94335.1 hypothetical protein CBF35_10210 [Vagococcus salmoninarum]
MSHDHNHDHEEDHEFITLVDEEGNEALFEILLTIDGEEEYANKQYVLLFPAGVEEDENEAEVELLAYEYIEGEDGTEGDLKNIETDAEWDMIEEVFNAFVEEEEA